MKFEGSYALLVHPRFEKVVTKNLPSHLKEVLDRKLNYLRQNPSHPSLNTKRLIISQARLNQLGVDEAYEFRINKKFRCIFCVDHNRHAIIIVSVGNHEEVEKFCK